MSAQIQEVAKRPDHLWKPGQSGNPSGRPKGRKNKITELKQELEIAVRDHLNPADIRKVVARMMELAIEGNVGAAKLILDKVLSNAKEADDSPDQGGTFIFEVKNLTLKHDEPEQEIIDITPTQETENVRQAEQPAPE